MAETVSQYGMRCKNVARNILGSEEDAEECLNDALLSAWNAIPPARPRHYGAYFLTLVRNFALKRYAAGHAEKRGGGQMPLALAELSDCLSSGENIEREIDRRVMLEAVKQFLGELPERQRNLFVRRYWYAAPISEIAADFEMTDINVKVTLSRIRNRLQKYLRKEGLL
ncbi:MAG: sigma-70 family RNA polymerase sigma factor [Oscillospiraceae bacterium]|nr:sigma-70 family RNA polymerase sigma factor [Oscillospiraceae bacterium]